MKAIWGSDYDYKEDKIFDCPCCPNCEEPIGRYKDGSYRCFSCGEIVDVEEPSMQEWFKKREGVKITYQNCKQVKTNDGKIFGCGGKNCLEIHSLKNPITLKWQVYSGKCNKCGITFIV